MYRSLCTVEVASTPVLAEWMTKINYFGFSMFGMELARPKTTTTRTVLTVKCGEHSVLLCGCMSLKGVGELKFIDATINTSLDPQIVIKKLTDSLGTLGRRGIF